jgi:pimeloyl-ACP methyl ester carboxylesterase
MTEPKTQTLDLPGSTLAYDVREADSESTEPVLLMIGSPMGASGFTTLAGYFPHRTVVTFDPRGAGRSPRTGRVTAATPDERAEVPAPADLRARRGARGHLASSGGAVNALALVTRHPGEVRTLVAHEPPLATVLPDGEEAVAVTEDIHETYERERDGQVHRRHERQGTDSAGLLKARSKSGRRRSPDRGRRQPDHPLLGPHMVYVQLARREARPALHPWRPGHLGTCATSLASRGFRDRGSRGTKSEDRTPG